MLTRISYILRYDSIKISLFLVFLLCLTVLGYVPSQSQFYWIGPLYLMAFLSYFLLLKTTVEKGLLLFIAGGILIRFVLIFAFPQLSDDIYRFVWDGRLLTHGFNPYSYYPPDVLNLHLPGLDEELYDSMNSPNYYTVYPPIAQLVYYIGALGKSITMSSILIKIVLFVAECVNIYLICKLLKHLKKPISLALIYTLNPLIIIELSGNLHFESLMISFILMCFYFLVKGNYHWAIISLAMGVATKLLPLLFFPFVWKYLHLKAKYLIIFAVSGMILFLPVIYGVHITHFLSSLDLYFGKFEFNASTFYLLRYVGIKITGYNLIRYLGPLLGLLSIYVIYRLYRHAFPTLLSVIIACFVAYCCYLLGGTTIHPWYLSIPVMLSCFLPLRFALVWSCMITLTYINYSNSPYHENLWIVGLEYLTVLEFLLYELFVLKKYETIKALFYKQN